MSSRKQLIPRKRQFELPLNDLTKIIDVDDNRGRSVPINMNFIEEGYLTKDTGIRLFGAVDMALRHSLFHYKKKNGTSFLLSGYLTKLQTYNFVTEVWEDITATQDVTITIATPGVVTMTNHGLVAGTPIVFSTTGALPTGITAGVTYYVIATGLTANEFQFSATLAGAAVNTTGGQSGIQMVTVARVWTTGAEFGFYTYNNDLYGCNAVEAYFKWTGSQFTLYPSAPKGNILENFEDRMFVSGVTAEPYSSYYSDVGDPLTFDPASVVAPLGTDSITNLKNYYGTLLIFKQNSIWKLTFQYDQVVALFVPKLELQSKNYGCAGRKAATWTENDIWFFTGREVRAIGFKDSQIGVLGVDRSVISTAISETLKYIDDALFPKCVVFYEDSRFYLGVPLDDVTVDTVFVCHTLYGNAWTKYTGRDKAKVNDFVVIDEKIHTTTSSGDFGVRQWDKNSLMDIDDTIASEVFFRRLEDKNFNRFRIYRYLDLDFKDLQADVTVTVKQEASDVTTSKTTTFHVGNEVEGEENGIGEVPPGQLLVADSYGEEVEASPYVKKRISFLSKAQALIIGLSNDGEDQTFTIAKMAVKGIEQPSKLFSSRNITSMS